MEQRFFSSSSFQLPAKNIAWKYDAYYYSWWCTFWKPPFIKNDIVAPNSTSTDRINIYTHTHKHASAWWVLRNLQNEQREMTSRYSFHSILNLNILFVVWMCVCACVFFASVGIYSPKIMAKMWIVFIQKKTEKKQPLQYSWCALSTEIYGCNSSLLFSSKIRLFLSHSMLSKCVLFAISLTPPLPLSFPRTFSGCNWQSQDKELCEKCVQFSWCVKKGDGSYAVFCHSPAVSLHSCVRGIRALQLFGCWIANASVIWKRKWDRQREREIKK